VKHGDQWENTLEAYATPVIGKLSVGAVDTGLVLRVLEPIWATKTETASRVRGRIESILDWAKVRGLRTGENPARWRGHLDKMLPKRSKIQKVKHHPALPYDRIGAFVAELQSHEAISALALEFLILTVGRTNEVIGFRWPELDRQAKIWTIPADRMKGGREHRVPLSDRAIEILDKILAAKSSDFVFPGTGVRKSLSNMALEMMIRRMNGASDPTWVDERGRAIVPHGFRSTFKDWASERTNFANEISESALAHGIEDKSEAAYRRGDLFEKRRRLMDAWAKFCAAPLRPSSITEIRSKATGSRHDQ